MNRILFVTPTKLSVGIEKFFWAMCHGAGVDRAASALITMVDEPAQGANGLPTKVQLDKHQLALDAALEESEATVVVPLGPIAFRRISGIHLGIDDARGYVFEPGDMGVVQRKALQQVGLYKTKNAKTGRVAGDPKMKWVATSIAPHLPPDLEYLIPVYHPDAVVMSGRKLSYALKADLLRVARAATLGVRPIGTIEYGPVSSTVGLGDHVAFDIETIGHTRAIDRIGLADSGRAVTAPWDGNARTRTVEILGRKDVVKVGHNLMFDIPRLEEAGCPVVGPIFDTMLAAQLLQPDLPKGLGRVSSLYLDAKPWKHLSEQHPAMYNAKDALMTSKLFDVLSYHLREEGMLDLFTKTIMPTVPVLMDMTARGLRVNRQVKDQWSWDLGQKLLTYHQQWQAIAPGVNPSSTRQLSQLLYGQWKMPAKRNKKDGITTDALALTELIRQCPDRQPALELLLAIRGAEKDLKTYANIELDPQNRVHPQYLPLSKDDDTARKGAAATGRLASSGPNIQQQTPEARCMYIPDEPDFTFIEADYSQAELWVLGAVSQDQALLKALLSDVHANTMKLIGCERIPAKTAMFGTAYGAGPKTISDMLLKEGVVMGIPACRELQGGIARAYPDMWAWRTWIADMMVQNHHLTNAFGRTRWFYGGTQDIPSAIDYIPQSTVADIVWDRLRAVAKVAYYFGGRLTTTVHDSFLIQVPDAHVDDAVRRLHNTLTSTFDNVAPNFRLPVGIKVGKTWGSMETYAEQN